MAQEEALVKISGDLLQREDVWMWIKEISQRYLLTIVIGGGTQISKALKAAGFCFMFHDDDRGREILSDEGKQLAERILERNREEVVQKLADLHIHAYVHIPLLYTDTGHIVHINGDWYAKIFQVGYDKTYVLTLESRQEEKEKSFEDYSKVQIKAFPNTQPPPTE